MKLNLLFCFAFLFQTVSFGQEIIERKKYVISVYTGVGLPFLNIRGRVNYPFEDDDIRLFYKPSILPPELGLAFEYGQYSKLAFHLSWRGIQNCGFIHETTDGQYAGSTGTFYTDSFMMKNDVYNALFLFKYYFERGENGAYASIGSGFSLMRSIVYPTQTKEEIVFYTENEKIDSKKLPPGRYNNSFFRLTGGFGYSVTNKSNINKDIGIRTSYYFGRRNHIQPYDSQGDISTAYRDYFFSILDYLQVTNIQSSYIIEFYLKFGIPF